MKKNYQHLIEMGLKHKQKKMKQLGIDVSPSPFVWNPYLTLANVTSDHDPCDL